MVAKDLNNSICGFLYELCTCVAEKHDCITNGVSVGLFYVSVKPSTQA